MKDWSTTPEKTAESPDGRPDRLAPAEGRDGSVHRVGPRSREPWPRWTSVVGSLNPPGASWVEEQQAFNFSLYSRHAERVRLLLFGEDDLARPVVVLDIDPRRNKTWDLWHCRLGEADAARRPLLRLLGRRPAARGPGRRGFDPDKVLLDPYAREVYFPPSFDREAARHPGPNAGHGPPGRPAPPRAGVRLGGRPAPAPRVGHGHLRDARARASRGARRAGSRPRRGAPSPAWSRRSPTSRTWASRSSSCCRCSSSTPRRGTTGATCR